MKIVNSTNFNTQDLKKLFLLSVKEVDKIEGTSFKNKSKVFSLEIRATSSLYTRGRASIGGHWIFAKIPRSWEYLDTDRKKDLARLFIHEYYHNIGFKYWDYHNYKYDSSKTWPVDWVSTVNIRLKERKKSVKKDLRLIRYQNALKKSKVAKTRLKRAETIFKNWEKKVKYYEKDIGKGKGNL